MSLTSIFLTSAPADTVLTRIFGHSISFDDDIHRAVIQELAAIAPKLINIDISDIATQVKELGLYAVAQKLGNDITHYDNLLMAGRLAIANLRLSIPKDYAQYIDVMQVRLDPYFVEFMRKHCTQIQEALTKYAIYDYDHDWFSANTIITMYSAYPSYDKPYAETPLYMWMRVAIQFYSQVSIEKVLKCFVSLAEGWYTPASPTLFNACMTKCQLASCFLMTANDNMSSILTTHQNMGMISKYCGGIGCDLSRLRCKVSHIAGLGNAQGLVPVLRMYNDLLRYVNQTTRRKGAGTFFLRPHHMEIYEFVSMVKKVGTADERAHDINVCIWTSNIFWRRIQEDGPWTLFCPSETPELNDVCGSEFERLYVQAENNPALTSKRVRARDLYQHILNVQREAGMPYIMNGDSANLKSNHRHMGYIRSSNLCLEIVEHTDTQNIASCNLQSLSLRKFVLKSINSNNTKYLSTSINDEIELAQAVDFQQLGKISREVLCNLNRLIDTTFYPLDQIDNGDGIMVDHSHAISRANKFNRPVAMGVSGFAEMLYLLDLSYDDARTNLVNKMVFACMYWNSLVASVDLAIKEQPYESFEGSPASEGKLQFDLWAEEFDLLGPNVMRQTEDDKPVDPGTWNQQSYTLSNGQVVEPTWEALKDVIKKYGLRNSLVMAIMPTASTAQIRRNGENVEPHQTNLYSRQVLKGTYPVLNSYMMQDLKQLNLWNEHTIEFLRIKSGSLQKFTRYVQENRDFYPKYEDSKRLEYMEEKYKTVWEISQKKLLILMAERSRYIDQSASLTAYFVDCTDEKLQAYHMAGYMLGLKTQMYYLRQPGGGNIKFTADPQTLASMNKAEKWQCTDEVCTSCT